MENNRKHVIAYASRKLKQDKAIRNYSSMKIEFLALHWAITKKFKDYLYGSKHQFVVRTDNHPLSKMMTTKQTAADMGKLSELADYNFRLEYKSGKANLAADALSRNPVSESDMCIQEQITAFISEEDGLTLVPDQVVAEI